LSLRRIAKGLVIVVAIGALLVLVATKIVHAAWNHERSGRSITKWASAAMSGHGPSDHGFVFDDVEWPWLPAVRSLFGGAPMPFVAQGITIFAPGSAEILHAHRVEGRLRLGHLVWTWVRAELSGHSSVELFIEDTMVDEVRCQISELADGKVDLVAAFKTPPGHGKNDPSASPRSGFIISVRNARVHDGTYAMHFPAWHSTLEHLRLDLARLRYSSYADEQAPGRPAFTYETRRVESSHGELVVSHRTIPISDFVTTRFEAVDPHRQDMMMTGEAHSLGASIAFHGSLTETYARGAHGIALALEVHHGRGLRERFVDTKSLSGDPTLSVRLEGRFADMTISGAVKNLDAKAAGIEASDVEAKYRYRARTLALRDIDSTVAGGHVRGAVKIELAEHKLSADLTLAGIDAKKLGREMPAETLLYLDGLALRVLHERQKTGDFVERLKIHGLTLLLHRRPAETFPYRIEVSGPYSGDSRSP
jgi:hypothetical protein